MNLRVCGLLLVTSLSVHCTNPEPAPEGGPGKPDGGAVDGRSFDDAASAIPRGDTRGTGTGDTAAVDSRSHAHDATGTGTSDDGASAPADGTSRADGADRGVGDGGPALEDTSRAEDDVGHAGSDTGLGSGDAAPTSGVRKKTSMGMNLNGISDWSTQLPFLDFMKQSRIWWPNGSAFQPDVDARDWVRSKPAGQEIVYIFLLDNASPYTRFVVRWKGQGTFSYVWGAKRIGSSHGGDLVEVAAGQSGALSIQSVDGADPLRDISVVPETFVARYDAGEIFNPDWVARIQDFRSLRFMDWMDTNNSTQKEWADRPKPTDRSWASKGVPVETMVALANQIGADPWFNMPHLATDSYVKSFASVVKSNLASHLVAYVEHSNEVWNWQFAQAQYANTEGRRLWGDVGTAWLQYNGMRAAQICDLWKKDVFGATEAKRVHCTLGVQTGYREVAVAGLACEEWVKRTGATACYRHGIDSLAITGYFSGCETGFDASTVPTIRSWFADPDQGVQRGVEQALDGRHLTSGGKRCTDTATGNLETYRYFEKLARDHGLALVAYEGGQHITANGSPVQEDADFQRFHLGINRSPAMKGVYQTNFENWKEAGGTLFMHFVDMGAPGKYGSWGALEGLTQRTSPKWEAITEFNARTCWWAGC